MDVYQTKMIRMDEN